MDLTDSIANSFIDYLVYVFLFFCLIPLLRWLWRMFRRFVLSRLPLQERAWSRLRNATMEEECWLTVGYKACSDIYYTSDGFPRYYIFRVSDRKYERVAGQILTYWQAEGCGDRVVLLVRRAPNEELGPASPIPTSLESAFAEIEARFTPRVSS